MILRYPSSGFGRRSRPVWDGSVSLRAQAEKPVPIADMHMHLGRRTRANSPLDLAEEMRSTNVLLAAWAYAIDRAYIKSMPDVTHQVAEPNPMKIAW